MPDIRTDSAPEEGVGPFIMNPEGVARFFAIDFLQASAAEKFVNIASNVAALIYFVPTANMLYLIAIPMAVFNMLGAFAGTWVAVKHGTGFVRLLFLTLLLILILKLAYDMVGAN